MALRRRSFVICRGIDSILCSFLCPRDIQNLGVAGGIIEKEAPIQGSNVAIFNTATNKADRIGFKIDGDKKIRIFKSTGEAVDA